MAKKLYTEEQVRRAMLHSYLSGVERPADYLPIEESILRELTPIELPSDEEAGVIALNIASTLKDSLESREEAFYLAGFQTCAKWMKEQTAVEWFIQNISKYIHYKYDEAYEQHQLVTLIFEQAKQMEKEQIIKAHGLKYYDLNQQTVTGEQYYNETYGENKD